MFFSISFCCMTLSKKGVTLSTEILGNAMPRIPSNLAAMKVMPGCFTASPKIWFLIFKFPSCREVETEEK